MDEQPVRIRIGGPLLVVAGTALLVALFVYLRPPASSDPPPAPAVTESPSAIVSNATVVDLSIRKNQLVSGSATVKVFHGDEVVLRFNADIADEIHLHGYDLTARVQPGTTAEIRFIADRTGRFEYESHRAHAALGVVEVHPR